MATGGTTRVRSIKLTNGGTVMNRKTIAKELLKVAEGLMAMEFDTKEEMEKYKEEHDVRPGTEMKVKTESPAKKEEKKLKVSPKHKTMNKEEHTHNFGKMADGDDDDTKVRVYDNGGKTIDRYSVVVEGEDWKSSASSGSVPMLSLSEGGKGVSQWGDGKEGKHLGRPVKWENLDKETQKHIEDRLKSSGQ